MKTPGRDDWPLGPWTGEPDREDFHHAGLPCILQRTDTGTWAGYVGLRRDHPDYGKYYLDVAAEVHGGVNYSKSTAGMLVHVADPGCADDLWWLGFDCGHLGDLAPSLETLKNRPDWPPDLRTDEGVYRTFAYAREQCMHLAEQLAEKTGAPP